MKNLSFEELYQNSQAFRVSIFPYVLSKPEAYSESYFRKISKIAKKKKYTIVAQNYSSDDILIRNSKRMYAEWNFNSYWKPEFQPLESWISFHQKWSGSIEENFNPNNLEEILHDRLKEKIEDSDVLLAEIWKMLAKEISSTRKTFDLEALNELIEKSTESSYAMICGILALPHLRKYYIGKLLEKNIIDTSKAQDFVQSLPVPWKPKI